MKSVDDIYKYLRENLLPALREKAIKDNWPGIWKRSFRTYECDDSFVGIELSFIDRTRYFEQKFYIEYPAESTYEEYDEEEYEDDDYIICQEERCTSCSIKGTRFCTKLRTRINFWYDILNLAQDKDICEKTGKAICDYVTSLVNSLEKNSKFDDYQIIDFQLAYGSYECYIPEFDISENEKLLDLIHYILVQQPFKLPIELVRLYEKRKEIHDYNVSIWRLLENKDIENDIQRNLRSLFLTEFVKEEFFSNKKEKYLSPEQRKELFEKMKKSNPHFKEITKQLNLKI